AFCSRLRRLPRSDSASGSIHPTHASRNRSAATVLSTAKENKRRSATVETPSSVCDISHLQRLVIALKMYSSVASNARGIFMGVRKSLKGVGLVVAVYRSVALVGTEIVGDPPGMAGNCRVGMMGSGRGLDKSAISLCCDFSPLARTGNQSCGASIGLKII